MARLEAVEALKTCYTERGQIVSKQHVCSKVEGYFFFTCLESMTLTFELPPPRPLFLPLLESDWKKNGTSKTKKKIENKQTIEHTLQYIHLQMLKVFLQMNYILKIWWCIKFGSLAITK